MKKKYEYMDKSAERMCDLFVDSLKHRMLAEEAEIPEEREFHERAAATLTKLFEEDKNLMEKMYK